VLGPVATTIGLKAFSAGHAQPSLSCARTFQFTVCTSTGDVLPLMFAVPPYTAVML
jgi:hypothetical protein